MQIPRRASIFSNEDENDDKKILTTVILTVFVLGACAEGQEKQGLGTLVGTGVGALLGSQIGKGDGRIAGIVIGAVAGGWLGSETGKKLDEADKVKVQQTA